MPSEEPNGPIKRLDQRIDDLTIELRRYIEDGKEEHRDFKKTFSDLHNELNTVRTDHVSRIEFGILNDRVTASSAARTTFIGVAAVVLTIFVGFLFYVLNHNITGADVSNQIQKEAPWNKDKGEFTRRLNTVEEQLTKLAQQFAQMKGG